jgi:hypothetical protein
VQRQEPVGVVVAPIDDHRRLIAQRDISHDQTGRRCRANAEIAREPSQPGAPDRERRRRFTGGVKEHEGLGTGIRDEPQCARAGRKVHHVAALCGNQAKTPDGLSIAVEVKRGDQTFIGVVARDGGPVTQLTFERGQSWPHSWAPDNDRIAFAGEREGVWNVYTVSRRTRAVTALTRFKSPSGYVRFPAWSPRGERVVFERSLRTGGVWTLTLPEE